MCVVKEKKDTSCAMCMGNCIYTNTYMECFGARI